MLQINIPDLNTSLSLTGTENCNSLLLILVYKFNPEWLRQSVRYPHYSSETMFLKITFNKIINFPGMDGTKQLMSVVIKFIFTQIKPVTEFILIQQILLKLMQLFHIFNLYNLSVYILYDIKNF